MTQRGVAVDLLTYGVGDDVEVPGLRIIRIPRLPGLRVVPAGPSYRKLLLDQLLLIWTIGLLLRRRYDFVHAHEEAVFFCLPLSRLFRLRLVYDMHSRLPDQLRNFGSMAPGIATRGFEWLEARALRDATAVITICPELASYAMSHGVEPARHFLIENTLLEPPRLSGAAEDPPPALRETEEHLDSLPAGTPLVVYAGTLERYQGIDLLLGALAALRPRLPQVRLVVLGGEEDQRRRYEDAAKSLGIGGSCRFTGRVPQAGARRICARATVQVSPRISGTNTPLKLYEQIASGVAIVATRVRSHTQVLDESAAFLADPDVAGLANALELALRTPALRADRAAAARRLYESRYSKEHYVGQVEALLRRLS